MSANANYRKLNDHSHNSSTYHKKDGTAVRAKLKQQMNDDVDACTKEELLHIDAMNQQFALPPTPPQVIDIMADLKKRSDVLCPVMEKIHPLSNAKFLELALVTLLDLGYEIKHK